MEGLTAVGVFCRENSAPVHNSVTGSPAGGGREVLLLERNVFGGGGVLEVL